MKLIPIFLLALSLLSPASKAAEPLLKPNDVIAFVGGEEMVAAAEQGHLELLLVRAFPDYHLKFRSLAWEGDTVFDQPRDLNYPTLEQQLDEIGASVVIAQFGTTESVTAPGEAAKFAAAYEKLIDRLGAGGKRRFVLVPPIASGEMRATRREALRSYTVAIKQLAERRQLTSLSFEGAPSFTIANFREGLHLNEAGQRRLAAWIAQTIGKPASTEATPSTDEFRLADAIRAKNRLWFHYARPQNWAFLNGDRTTQPSSRDHLDPSKRWFPEEMKQWLPLIGAREEGIWKLAHEMKAR